jgi:aspartate kinase
MDPAQFGQWIQQVYSSGPVNPSSLAQIDEFVNRDDALDVLEGMRKRLKSSGVICDGEVSKVSIVGAGMANNPGVAAKMFEALAEAGINIQMISTSEIKISVLIEKKNADRAVAAIHEAFFPV